MTLPFLIFLTLTALVLGGALAAMMLRDLIHSALALAVSLLGLAAVYLTLQAQFAGFAQVLVYVGAVAIVIVFAILLTRGSDPAGQPVFARGWPWGAAAAVAVFGVLAAGILRSPLAGTEPPAGVEAHAAEVGKHLMAEAVLPLEVTGLILTVALIGAAVIALREKVES